MSKRKHHTLVSKPLAARTFDVAKALADDKSPEARKKHKDLKASHSKKYVKRVTMAKVAGFWNPEGKRQARGSSLKCTKINRVHKARS